MSFDKVKYDNDYAKNNYDRIPINVPKGRKPIIETHSKSKGYKSLNAYVNDLINTDMLSNSELVCVTQTAVDEYSAEEKRLVELFRQADDRGKRKILGNAELEAREQESSASKIG